MLGSLAALLIGPVVDECWPDIRENRFFILVGIIRSGGRGLALATGCCAPSAQNENVKARSLLVALDKC